MNNDHKIDDLFQQPSDAQLDAGQQVQLNLFESLVKSAAFEQPDEGFVDRWKLLAAERTLKSQKNVIKHYWFFLICANFTSAALLILLFLFTGAPIKGVMNGAVRVATYIENVEAFYRSFVHFFANIPAYVPITLVLVCVTAFIALLVVWLAALWRYALKGGNYVTQTL